MICELTLYSQIGPDLERKRILTEAAGSPVSSYMIKAIKASGHVSIASDISKECAAYYLSDEFVVFPNKNDYELWNKVERCLIQNKVDIVIPSFDEMLHGWAKRREAFESEGIQVLVSPVETIETFQDKWKTACFFEENDLPCAKSSLDPIYPLIKPRFGRGSAGVTIEFDAGIRSSKFKDNDISQTILKGEEFTVDCLFDLEGKPLYIIPRKRLDVINGKSTGGEVVKNPRIEKELTRLSKCIKFVGPINVQCFIDESYFHFVEVNPRIAGGMALSFAATTNWIPHFVEILKSNTLEVIEPIKWGIKMFRTYQEFYSQ